MNCSTPGDSVPLLVVSEEKTGDSASEKAGYLQRQLSVEYGQLSVPGIWREKANHLQRQLLGLVKVVSYDHDTAWRISKDLPRPLRCYDGAMRLYSPGCSQSDVSQQHPYWLPSDMDKLGPDMMLSMLRDECIIRLPRQGRRRMFSRVRDAIRRKETEELEAKLDEFEHQTPSGETLQALWNFAVEVMSIEPSDDADSVSQKKHDALWTVARSFKNKSDILELENKRLREDKGLSETGPRPSGALHAQPSEDESGDPKPEFVNILEVVQWADRELDGLRFFPSALESAEPVAKSGQFKRTDKLRRVFEVMNECAKQRRGGSIGRLTQWFKDRQVTYARGESKSTNEQLPDTRIFGGLRMEEHFKLRDDSGGRFELRMYVLWDEGEYQWLIGHVGEHEPTATDPH